METESLVGRKLIKVRKKISASAGESDSSICLQDQDLIGTLWMGINYIKSYNNTNFDIT